MSTIAYQLALRNEHAREALLAAISVEPPITERNIEAQCRDLLCTPLDKMYQTQSASSRSNQPRRLVIVIDGLDECDSMIHADGEVMIQHILTAIHAVTRGPSPKILLSSRHEETFHSMLERAVSQIGRPMPSVLSTMRLHEVSHIQVQDDIRCYLQEALTEIKRRSRLVSSEWTIDSVLDHLALLSDTLFVHAATMVRFIGDSRHLPARQVDILLGLNARSVPHNMLSPYLRLDQLYTDILARAVGVDEHPSSTVDDPVCSQIRLVLATILFCEESLAVLQITELAFVDARSSHNYHSASIFGAPIVGR